MLENSRKFIDREPNIECFILLGLLLLLFVFKFVSGVVNFVERRVIGLEKRIQEVGCEVDVANGEMEEVKCIKETTEQELKGYELQLALNEASIQTLEARISIIQDEISSVGSQVEGLKNEEGASRKFQEEKCIKSQKKSSIGTTAEPDRKAVKKVVTEVELRALEDILAHVASQTTKEEQEYIAEENIQNQVQKEYIDLQRKFPLMEAIVKETKALQDLTRQASELEQNYASLGEQLQKRCVCPLCRADNVEVLGGVLQANEAN
ncbi:uncharacterized protein LOC7495933 isoform X2 [Populus trichocarpa]|uniref:uncharacterized protein LOC7495933 isoform X2 n=1 Tax=Populus trichocarpa TaxID=3694 RepID=UPI002277A574|nr:uncharacterized protein LOC7495933 isoform X2 [Populus trichocarpa]